MDLLFRIVYAAHAKGTHHKIALDALKHLANTDAPAWRRVFLKHSDAYMEGAKAPDTAFKDFKNHVLHVRDNYWGGAPEKALSWYGLLVESLQRKDWPQVAYSAGVLSHYYSDPIMPFHTAQSDAESAIHRAAEWSISRSYDALMAAGEQRHGSLNIVRPQGENWLKDLVIQGAETSNPHYEKLIAHYDINAGVIDPPTGLDSVARDIVAELLMYATKGYALILDQAIAESKAAAPDVSLTLETLIATLKIPIKFVQKRLADAEDRRQVEAMYDELKTTGQVAATLPEDDRVVRNLYAREVLGPREAMRQSQRAQRLTHTPTPRPQARKAIAPPAAAAHGGDVSERCQQTPAAPGRSNSGAPERSLRHKITLSATDDIEAAPSIGPKMAERLSAIGPRTVGDLLSADADDIALKLDDRRITAETVRDWQDQARLVMTIAGLRGGHAQLLVGAGYRSGDAVGAASAEKLCADVLAFAASANGQRILRDSGPPDVERITAWIEGAQTSLAA